MDSELGDDKMYGGSQFGGSPFVGGCGCGGESVSGGGIYSDFKFPSQLNVLGLFAYATVILILIMLIWMLFGEPSGWVGVTLAFVLIAYTIVDAAVTNGFWQWAAKPFMGGPGPYSV